MKKQIRICGTIMLSLAAFSGGNVVAASAVHKAGTAGKAVEQQTFFAKIDDVVISHDEYDVAFNSAARSKFYHGNPPENEVAALQREVGEQLVSRVLLVREARRRGIQSNKTEIDKTLQGYEQRYATTDRWKQTRDQVLPGLTARLEEDSLVAELERVVRNVPRAPQKEVKAYYAANLDKFTEPEQLRISVILIKVDPSSPTEAWEKADRKVKELIKQLDSGADFAALAREHSNDHTAKHGGNLGYLHKGMLPDGTETVLAPLKIGEISKAVHLLEGVAVFQVTDRKAAKVNSFERVEVRAGDLLHRDESDAAWKKLVTELKKKTPALIDQSRFLPLAQQAGKPSQKPK